MIRLDGQHTVMTASAVNNPPNRGPRKTTLPIGKKSGIFSQTDVSDAAFYIQAGKVKPTVISHQREEAIVGILGPGDFLAKPAWPARQLAWRLQRLWPPPQTCASRKLL